MRYMKINKFDTANGSGIGVVLWVSGCLHHCKGCHNPETWSPAAGENYTEYTEDELIMALSPDYITRLTFSGGDPLYFTNIEPLSRLAKLVKLLYPNKVIWLYTGHTYEQIQSEIKYGNLDLELLMKCVDVLVDGEYQEGKKDVSLPYCGSSNQRLIDVTKSSSLNKIVLYEEKL